MASNMWKAVENECENCGVKLDAPRKDGETYEDGTPREEGGATLEDETGYKFTVCETCLSLIVNGAWMELEDRRNKDELCIPNRTSRRA